MSRTRLLSREAKLRAGGLLDMLYTPTELAEELGIAPWEVYRKIEQGLPVTRDKEKNLYVHGPAVAQWLQALEDQRRIRDQKLLGRGEAYCLHCRKAVPITNPVRTQQGKFVTLAAKCPFCGRRVHRGIKAL